jgi:predicted secreted protein
MTSRLVAVAATLVVAALAAASAPGTAPPVGQLPKGPVTSIRVHRGQLFALVVPKPAAGLSWRGARRSDATVARPLDEGELNGNVVFVYRAGHAGRTTVVYALTRDEQRKALGARYFAVTVF